MNRTYLRYEHARLFGVIASRECNVVVDVAGAHVLVLAGAAQDVLAWRLSSGELQFRLAAPLEPGTSVLPREVTVIELDEAKAGSNVRYFASGDGSGKIRLWHYVAREHLTVMKGHTAAVTCLKFSSDSTRMISGSKDTDIVLWDLVAQTGLFRLKGHKQEVTDLCFLSGGVKAMSASKDMLIKVWNLDQQHCEQTLVGHRSPVWSLAANNHKTRVLTASSDQSIRAIEFEPSTQIWRLMEGSVTRGTAERAAMIKFSQGGNLVACQSAGKTLEILRVRQGEEVHKRMKRRLRKLKEKGKEENESERETHVSDGLEPLAQIRTDHKMRAFAFVSASASKSELVVSYTANHMELYSLEIQHGPKRNRELQLKRTRELELQGHRTDVRAMALSSDDSLLLTAASGAAKLWNIDAQNCIRTFKSGYSLCCAFVPGDMHALIGTKSGHLFVMNLISGDLIEEIEAHDAAIWSLDVKPDGKGFCTGSADKEIKFWEFELSVEDKEKLEVVHTRTLKMTDEVMAVKYSYHRSPSGLVVAAALLDCTVKVFYEDSLKFALSLYGHKLPILSMDISDDNTLLVTGSADKNIKIWGLDFGDCHKSFFAHDDSVMCVRFVPKTHYVFSAGKDHRIRYWDADKFEMILSLEAHIGEVWSLAIASDGSFFLSTGHDKTIRIWDRTNDIVFLEEEREKELEISYDKTLMNVREEEDGVNVSESAAPTKRTDETLKAGERLMEALDVADAEQEKDENNLHPNPLLLGKSPQDHVIFVLQRIKAAELDEALMVQPFSYALRLFPFLERALETRVTCAREQRDVEVVAKVVIALLRTHFKQIVATQSLKSSLIRLKDALKNNLGVIQDSIGSNLAGIKLLQEQINKM